MQTLAETSVRAAITQRLGSVTQADQAQWGLMCAGEMLCHVLGAFRAAMGEVPVEPVRLRMPPALLKQLSLWAPVAWPKNFRTVRELERGAPAMQTGRFEEDRESAVSALERFCRPGQARASHPMFGALTEREWMRWGFLHTDHHLRQFGR